MVPHGTQNVVVQHAPRVYVIFWGSAGPWGGSAAYSNTVALFQRIGGSAWQAILGQYAVFGNETLAGATIDTTDGVPGAPQWSDINNLIVANMSRNGWTTNSDTQWIVVPSSSNLGNLGFTSQVCALHSHVLSGVADIIGTPGVNTVTGCNGYSPDNTFVHAATVLASHEYAEAATDPSTQYGYYGNAEAAGSPEVGDMCQYTSDYTVNGQYVQRLWDSVTLSCVDTSSFGSASGSTGGTDAGMIGMAATSDAEGYWLAASDGGIFTFGDAGYYGSMGGHPLNKPIVGMAATSNNGGYWEVGGDGGIFAFGNAGYYGSMGGKPLNAPIVGMARTPNNGGYWLVGADGGIFAFGNAGYYGSMGGKPLNKPIVGMAATPNGGGYWLVGADGGIFAFGNAGYYGSTGGQTLNRPISGMAATPDGGGYWLVGQDGGIFTFGDAAYYGSMGSTPAQWPVLGVVTRPGGGGYEEVDTAMQVNSFGGRFASDASGQDFSISSCSSTTMASGSSCTFTLAGNTAFEQGISLSVSSTSSSNPGSLSQTGAALFNNVSPGQSITLTSHGSTILGYTLKVTATSASGITHTMSVSIVV